MRTTVLATKALKRTALAAALCAGTYTAASATPLTFTWNPSATGNTTAGSFTADNFGIRNFATIHVPTNPSAPGAVTESGFLEISGFDLGTVPVSTVHTVGAGGYGIYETFTTTSHLSPVTGGFLGEFDSITASMYLYSTVHGLASYNFSNPSHNPTIHLPTGAHPVLLGTETGPLADAVVPNFAEITKGIPSANVGVTFIPNAAESGFFVKPTASIILALKQAFITTGTIVGIPSNCNISGTLPCVIEIKGGGGTGNFLAVPEPASLLLLGAGVGAIALVRRRRA